jgi:hypothetical protein
MTSIRIALLAPPSRRCRVGLHRERRRASIDSALTTAAAEMKWINGWSAAATFDGEFSGITRSYAGKGVVRYAW